jgi:hypothetical protein
MSVKSQQDNKFEKLEEDLKSLEGQVDLLLPLKNDLAKVELKTDI